VIGRLLRWLLKLVLALLLLAVGLVVLFRFVHPPTSAFMVEQRLAAMFDGDLGYRNRYEWVPLEGISQQAAIAVIASEDQQFAYHTGFDFKSIREAVRHNAAGRRVRGASTISQQVAKNLFLWSGRSYVRKGIEAGFTLLIEWIWPKERILEVYLNIAQFGRNVFGVEAAAQQFYRRPARRLNREQAAVLAAVLPNPVRLRADAPSAYVLSRRNWILGQMNSLGGVRYLDELDAAQEREAKKR
jgi:monofunctional glycosyltransferase